MWLDSVGGPLGERTTGFSAPAKSGPAAYAMPSAAPSVYDGLIEKGVDQEAGCSQSLSRSVCFHSLSSPASSDTGANKIRRTFTFATRIVVSPNLKAFSIGITPVG
jgi:hypothetical protein